MLQGRYKQWNGTLDWTTEMVLNELWTIAQASVFHAMQVNGILQDYSYCILNMLNCLVSLPG